MIDIDRLTETDKGRGVIYTRALGDGSRRERGVLSSWNEKYIFARFTKGETAAACNPSDLDFARRRCVDGCPYCEIHKDDQMMPYHGPSPRCESGSRPHCTCDVCF